MTIPQKGHKDPFRKHFKKIKLLRFTPDLLNESSDREDDGFISLIQLTGKIIEIMMHNEQFIEFTLLDQQSSQQVKVISFLRDFHFKIDDRVTCVGTVHLNWTPDMRSPDLCYRFALKSVSIKPERP